MKVILFENVKELNEYLGKKKEKEVVQILHSHSVVGKTKDQNGREAWEIVDRFTAIER